MSPTASFAEIDSNLGKSQSIPVTSCSVEVHEDLSGNLSERSVCRETCCIDEHLPERFDDLAERDGSYG